MEINAHGLGGGADLPIPASFAIAGGTAALVVSFVVLILAWRQPRFGDGERGIRLPGIVTRVADHSVSAWALRTAGIVVFAYATWAAVLGEDLLTNPVFGMVFVWLWVGFVPLSLLFGPVYRNVSPARTLHLVLVRATRGDPERGIATLPPWVGCWPAALGLLAFVWFELVYPEATYLAPLRLWFALYLMITILGAAVFGSGWFARADPFEVYSTLVGHLSPLTRNADGALVLQSPLRHLATLRPEPGLLAVTSVLLGSTAYDSFRESTLWIRFSQSTTANVTLINTATLVATCALVAVVYFAAVAASGPGKDMTPRQRLPRRLAAAMVPIIVGYMVAHYLTFLVEVGQMTLIQASDPLSNGSDLLGTSDWQINYWLSNNPDILASIKVLAIVLGHVVGVIAAHDRSLELLPERRQIVGQLPLLGTMTLYTFSGLYLLFGL